MLGWCLGALISTLYAALRPDDGLKNLISSFDRLYAVMPDAQKKIADVVFSSSRT